MKILVIDDSQKNLDSAVQTLAGHDVTLCSAFEDAVELLNKEQFEVVLTDLMMPAITRKNITGKKRDFLNKEMITGWSLALVAAMNGTKYVVVASMANHHVHPGSAILDNFSGCSGDHVFSIDGAKVMLTSYITTDDVVELDGEEEVNCSCRNGINYDYSCCCHGAGIVPELEEVPENWVRLYQTYLSFFKGPSPMQPGEQCRCGKKCEYCNNTGKKTTQRKGKNWARLLDRLLNPEKENN